MKRVTAIYTMDFDDETTDDECYKAFAEVLGQDRHWPDDNQVRIEQLPDGTPDPTRPL